MVLGIRNQREREREFKRDRKTGLKIANKIKYIIYIIQGGPKKSSRENFLNPSINTNIYGPFVYFLF